MANDTKMQGQPILRGTSCRVGRHVFTWASNATFANSKPSSVQRCDCGAYSWAKLQKLKEDA